jgi:predicted DNA-binding transcriptional regulator AlpA
MFTKSHRREPHRLIRIREVLRKVGVKQSTWYEDIKAGRAPPPVKIGLRSVAWYEPDIDDLIDARLEGREWRPLGDAAKQVVEKLERQVSAEPGSDAARYAALKRREV